FMLAANLGRSVPWLAGHTKPLRGYFLFTSDHTFLALDEQTIVHANMFAMLVTIEPLADLLGRVGEQYGGGGGVTAVRRL
ncbi:MAG: hypothetical protein ACTSY1_05170, partial [Alphaproteobacteria bacterium]